MKALNHKPYKGELVVEDVPCAMCGTPMTVLVGVAVTEVMLTLPAGAPTYFHVMKGINSIDRTCGRCADLAKVINSIG